jgi:putative ABC transport system ATP-binding protein
VNLSLEDVTINGRRGALLQGVNLAVSAGQFLALRGPSGTGKTTLLNCCSGVATPAAGDVRVLGKSLTGLSPKDRAEVRLRHIGFVFQFAELLPELTAVENVALPLRLLGASRPQAEGVAGTWLERLGVSALADAKPDEMSGGEMQRVGICRAVAKDPAVILADEPTGMLDAKATAATIQALKSAAESVGAALIVATHDPLVAERADESVTILNGRLVPDQESIAQGVRC